MTPNKGIDLLLKAFAETSRTFRDARLVLKGFDQLFSSKDRVLAAIKDLPTHDQARVVENCIYLGEPVTNQEIARPYQAADAYVAPYRAEGFNLPELEAAACGIPIICNGDGPTEDFVTDLFCRKIESKYVACKYHDEDANVLEPNLDHLVNLMNAIIEDATWRKGAAQSGPMHVAAHFTWDSVVSNLVDKLGL
jgi:glycosyltransferase involved in cell wall biosynthesis